MPTVYSSTGTQWPLLQSKTEQKFKSGLFNVSAEFIRPVGNTGLPTEIETSIGAVDVWPSPAVSSGTDGFERINATGYGVWDASITEETFNFSLYEMPIYYFYQRGPSSQFFFPEARLIILPVIVESVTIKKTGHQIPLPSRPLQIAWPSPLSVFIPETSANQSVTPDLNQGLSFFKKNIFGGQAAEIEAIYEIRPSANLGTFYAPGAP